MRHPLQIIIETAYNEIEKINRDIVHRDVLEAVDAVLNELNLGKIRSAEKINNTWVVHEWIKKAILLSFKLYPNVIIPETSTQYYDRIPLKFANWSEQDFQSHSLRVLPGAVVRSGAYISNGVILMPSFVNIGAFLGSGTMIDTWATVGSCAQIGKNVHLSGGVGIGGVLEPLQATPTIIEDNCFIGARSEIVEGVIVEEGAVISMGVFIGKSTKIYNRMTGEITYGRVPKGAVVVPGNLPAKDGSYSLYCAVIIKQVDEKTRSKTSINELLRELD